MLLQQTGRASFLSALTENACSQWKCADIGILVWGLNVCGSSHWQQEEMRHNCQMVWFKKIIIPVKIDWWSTTFNSIFPKDPLFWSWEKLLHSPSVLRKSCLEEWVIERSLISQNSYLLRHIGCFLNAGYNCWSHLNFLKIWLRIHSRKVERSRKIMGFGV